MMKIYQMEMKMDKIYRVENLLTNKITISCWRHLPVLDPKYKCIEVNSNGRSGFRACKKCQDYFETIEREAGICCD